MTIDFGRKVGRLRIRDDSRALDTTYALLSFTGFLEWVRSDHMAVYVYKGRHYEFLYFSLTFESHIFPFSRHLTLLLAVEGGLCLQESTHTACMKDMVTR